MKMFNLNSRLARRATATLALGLLLGAQMAMACTVDNWNGGNSGNVTAGGPDSGGIARYAGVCAMETPAATETWVQDDSPGGIDRIRARFYVLADNSADAVVYRGFTSTDAALFGVRLNPVSGNVTLFSAGVNATCAGCANAGAWNSIEIDWNAGAGSLDLWVNSDATSDAADASASFSTSNTVSSVRLGNLDGVAGTLNFDAYESRRTTEIGRLCRADADGDGARTLADLEVIFTEIQSLGFTPAPGVPDGNENGSVDLGDLDVVFNFIQSLQGDCAAFPG